MICCMINYIIFWQKFMELEHCAVVLSLMQQEVLKETLAALVLLRVDMLRLAWSSSESLRQHWSGFE